MLNYEVLKAINGTCLKFKKIMLKQITVKKKNVATFKSAFSMKMGLKLNL